MTKDEAVAMYDSGWWKTKTAREIVAFQLYERLLCMPFGEFHATVEAVLGRPVWTHEFAGRNLPSLKAEYEGKRGPASFSEVLGQLTELGKPILVVTKE